MTSPTQATSAGPPLTRHPHRTLRPADNEPAIVTIDRTNRHHAP